MIAKKCSKDVITEKT